MKKGYHGFPLVLAILFLLPHICASEQAPPKTQTPHPSAVPNEHAAGVVDRPELVPFIVRNPDQLAGIVLDETDAELVENGSIQRIRRPTWESAICMTRRREKGKSQSPTAQICLTLGSTKSACPIVTTLVVRLTQESRSATSTARRPGESTNRWSPNTKSFSVRWADSGSPKARGDGSLSTPKAPTVNT